MIPQHSSKSNEHYTPPDIIEGVRAVLGSIDLDPASCEVANTIVKAKKIYTKEDDGLVQDWLGRVFLNPPGGKPTGKNGKRINVSNAQRFYFKLVREFLSYNTHSAIFLGFTLEILRLSQADPNIPSILRFPFCVCHERLDFLDENLVPQTDPSHANVLVLLPDTYEQVDKFELIFSCFGDVVIPRSIAWRPK